MISKAKIVHRPTTSTIAEPTNTYVLESSTNLVEWNVVTNVVASADLDTNSVFRIRATEQ